MLLDINGALFGLVNGLAGHAGWADDAMVRLANDGVYAVFALVCLSWFLRTGDGRANRLAVYGAAIASIVAIATAAVVQHAYPHDRPFVVRSDVVLLMHHSADASFPSQHTSVAAALAAGAGAWRQRLGIALMAIALAQGFARVYAGIHWPADVAGALLIGIAAGGVAWLLRAPIARVDDTVVRRYVPAFLLSGAK